jgi:PAS domain S-box-containing protein
MAKSKDQQTAGLPNLEWVSTLFKDWDGLIYIGDPDYRIRFMNQRFIDTLGRDATGESCYQALHGRSDPCPWCPQEVFSGQSASGLFQNPLDGRWYQVCNNPIPLGDGTFAKAAFIHDAAEPDSEVRTLPVFRNIVDHLSDAIFFHHPDDGSLLYVNDLACRMLGYDRETLLQMQPADYAEMPAFSQAWRLLLAEIAEQGFALFETRFRPSEAPGIDVECKASRVQAGLQEFIVIVARDISERKQAEAHLIEERNKVDAIMAAMGDAITVVDRNYRIIYQNEVMIRRSGQHLGEPCYRIYVNRDQVCDECQARMSFTDGGVHCRPFSTTTSDGQPLHFEITSSPLRDATGRITACVEVVRDVTARRLLEQSREEAFSAVSHEIRTPLTSVLGFAQYLQDHATTETQQQEYLGLIVKEGERLKRLIDNLLSLQRLRAGFGLFDPGPVLLYPLLYEVAERYRPILTRQRIELDCLPELPRVQGEALKLHEVLSNLVDNAIKYAPPESRIVLGARADGKRVLLWVEDQGPGIPADQQEKIFERFYRMAGPGKIAGTGLGLALVKEIVQAHNGRVWVESEAGRGSTFYLSLPALL